MSARCTAAVYDRYPAGGGEFALALALADNAHEDGTHIFPSVKTMAEKSRQSERSVQRCLRRMIGIGWLEVVKNGRGGAGRFVEYRISAAWLKGADLSPFFEAVDNSKKGDNQRTKRVTTEAQKGDNQSTPYITTRTSIEPPQPPAGGECGSPNQESGERGPADADPASASQALGFDAVAALYLRKDYMLRARKQWAQLAPDAATQERMAEAIQAWNRSPRWQAEGGRYIPKFCNWLRNELWRDAPRVAATSPAATKSVEPSRPAAPMTEEVKALRDRLLPRRKAAEAKEAEEV